MIPVDELDYLPSRYCPTMNGAPIASRLTSMTRATRWLFKAYRRTRFALEATDDLGIHHHRAANGPGRRCCAIGSVSAPWWPFS